MGIGREWRQIGIIPSRMEESKSGVRGDLVFETVNLLFLFPFSDIIQTH